MKQMKAVRSSRPGGRSSRGVSGKKGGSLITAMRKPASENASDMACKGRCQKVSAACSSPKVYSDECCVPEK